MLYHGTAARFVPSTLKHGLKPRGRKASNWNENPNRPDMVYLTTTYPFDFATMWRPEKKTVVFEVDPEKLDPKLLHPDEDFIGHLLYERDRKEPTEEQRKYIHANLDIFRNMCPRSVKELGNCAYLGTVPPKAITRYGLFDAVLRPELAFEVQESPISTLNYAMYGRYNQQIVEWCFGDRKLLPMVAQADDTEQQNFWLEQSNDRSGIAVVRV